VVTGEGRGDRDAVGAVGLGEIRVAVAPARPGPDRRVAVERRQLRDAHALDVAADAPLGEAQRHPRLEAREEPRPHLRMRMEVVVEPVGEGVHQLAEPRRTRAVLRAERVRVDEQPHAQVLEQRGLTVHLRATAQGAEVVHLESRKSSSACAYSMPNTASASVLPWT
jgi:hypothetical protein